MEMDTTNLRYIRGIRERSIEVAIESIKNVGTCITNKYRYDTIEYSTGYLIEQNARTLNTEFEESKTNYKYLVEEIENLQSEVKRLNGLVESYKRDLEIDL